MFGIAQCCILFSVHKQDPRGKGILWDVKASNFPLLTLVSRFNAMLYLMTHTSNHSEDLIHMRPQMQLCCRSHLNSWLSSTLCVCVWGGTFLQEVHKIDVILPSNSSKVMDLCSKQEKSYLHCSPTFCKWRSSYFTSSSLPTSFDPLLLSIG